MLCESVPSSMRPLIGGSVGVHGLFLFLLLFLFLFLPFGHITPVRLVACSIQFNSIQLLYFRLNSIIYIQVVHNNLRSI